MENSFQIRQITEADMPVILSLICELADMSARRMQWWRVKQVCAKFSSGRSGQESRSSPERAR